MLWGKVVGQRKTSERQAIVLFNKTGGLIRGQTGAKNAKNECLAQKSNGLSSET